MHWCFIGLAACLALLVTGQAQAYRTVFYLDGGVPVEVDNISSYSEWTAQNLVLAADRSTQSGCPYSAAKKGLIASGDRVVISDHYIAWIDFTDYDGVSYPGAMSGRYTRSGELAGYWSLNPATQMFKYFTPASATNCWNWPRNELLPGSASPSGEQVWWDRYAPALEHTIAVVTSLDPAGNAANDKYTFLSTVYSQGARNGGWSLLLDGRDNGDGSVTYLSGGRMANPSGQVDLVDGNDGNGVQGVMNYELEYVFRGRDILVAWRFSPSRTVSSNNAYIYYWAAHAPGQGRAGPECVDPPGSGTLFIPNALRPVTSFTQTWFAQASVPLQPSFATGGYPAGTVFPAGQAVQMVPGVKCNNTYPTHVNQDINSWPSDSPNNTVVGNGTWLRVGESAGVYSTTQRYLTYLHLLGYPNGTGTKSNPFDFRFSRLLAGNETWDGHYGFGVAAGPYVERAKYSVMQGGKWYYALHALTSDY
jgi:hypothetical protein